MSSILNLTQHNATVDQVSAGVVEVSDKAALAAALTFNALPTAEEISARAEAITEIAKAHGAATVMIGGAPYLMSALERALISAGIQPVYAYSERVSVETVDAEGNVTKSMVFKHQGFVNVA